MHLLDIFWRVWGIPSLELFQLDQAFRPYQPKSKSIWVNGERRKGYSVKGIVKIDIIISKFCLGEPCLMVLDCFSVLRVFDLLLRTEGVSTVASLFLVGSS